MDTGLERNPCKSLWLKITVRLMITLPCVQATFQLSFLASQLSDWLQMANEANEVLLGKRPR